MIRLNEQGIVLSIISLNIKETFFHLQLNYYNKDRISHLQERLTAIMKKATIRRSINAMAVACRLLSVPIALLLKVKCARYRTIEDKLGDKTVKSSFGGVGFNFTKVICTSSSTTTNLLTVELESL